MTKRKTIEEKHEICIYAKQTSVKQAAEFYNVSTGSIYKWMKDLGYSKKKKSISKQKFKNKYEKKLKKIDIEKYKYGKTWKETAIDLLYNDQDINQFITYSDNGERISWKNTALNVYKNNKMLWGKINHEQIRPVFRQIIKENKDKLIVKHNDEEYVYLGKIPEYMNISVREFNAIWKKYDRKMWGIDYRHRVNSGFAGEIVLDHPAYYSYKIWY